VRVGLRLLNPDLAQQFRKSAARLAAQRGKDLRQRSDQSLGRGRYTGMAIGFNVSVAIFGGTAPLVATLLIKITGDNQAPAFYLIGASVLNLAVLSRIPESHRTDIG
jgi:hypothetical protein